jgi:hypothetical protein
MREPETVSRLDLRDLKVSGWSFRYLDVRQMVSQSRQFETKELALKEACSYDRAGNAVLSLEGPGDKLTAVDISAWCAKNDS